MTGGRRTSAGENGVTDTLKQPVLLGRIVGLFGVKGWVKVYSYTEPREAVLDYEDWLLGRNDDWQTVELAEGKRHGKSVVARLQGIEDRDAAAALVGSEIGEIRARVVQNGWRLSVHLPASAPELRTSRDIPLGLLPAGPLAFRESDCLNPGMAATTGPISKG